MSDIITVSQLLIYSILCRLSYTTIAVHDKAVGLLLQYLTDGLLLQYLTDGLLLQYLTDYRTVYTLSPVACLTQLAVSDKAVGPL